MKHLLLTFIILCSSFSSQNKISAQNSNNQASELNAWIDSTFTEALNSVNIAGATIVVMQGDSVFHLNGYGLADIESNTPVNGNSSIFGVASISKTFVATAAMQLVEDGKLDLDRDVNNYLTSFQLDYKFKDSITVRHLLTHTAGFEDRNISTAVRSEKDVIPLAQFLKTRMAKQIRPAGVAISYSNHGYALVGLIIEEVSSQPFHEYVKQWILKPLRMNNTGFKCQKKFKENYVTSYRQKGKELIPYQSNFLHDYPAGALATTSADMGNYIAMLLNKGHFKGNHVLDSTTVDQMHETAFKHYEKTEIGWLLGFYESYWNDLRLVRHAGAHQGFASDLILVPEKNIGFFLCVNSSNVPHSASRVFIDEFTQKLLSHLIPDSINEKKKVKDKPTVGFVDEPLEAFTGTYRSTRHAYTTINKLAILSGFNFEAEVVLNDSTLKIVEFNNTLVPISDLTFHSDWGNYLSFGRDVKGDIYYLFNDAYAFYKLKWYEPVKFQKFWVGSIILILLIYVIASVVRRLFMRKQNSPLIYKINFSLATNIVLFMGVFAFALLKMDPQEFSYGLSMLFKVTLVLPLLILPLELISFYLLVKAIRFKELGTFNLIYQSLIVVAVMCFIPWLMYYNLIGFNY